MIMKRKMICTLVLVSTVLVACNGGAKNTEPTGIEELIKNETAVYETKERDVYDTVKESVNKKTESEHTFDSKVKFKYTLDDKEMKAITEDMVKFADEYFGTQGVVEIPTPRVVKIDNSDDNDIKYYGDFAIYGYEMDGTVFHTKNSGSFLGCYHLKKSGNKVVVVSKEFAEDGSDNWSSLLRICGDDGQLAKNVSNKDEEEMDYLKMFYATMYANANKIKLSGIKDYGWPIMLRDDISNAEFAYNFYNSYFDEIREKNDLNDLPERLDRLKEKYFTKDLIDKINDLTMDMGADMVINAQDVTDQMVDSLEASDIGGGHILVTYDYGSEKRVTADIIMAAIMGKKVITDISFK